MTARSRAVASVLPGCALQDGDKELAVGRDGCAFKTLIVLTPRLRIGRNRNWSAGAGIVRREIDLPVPSRQQCGWWLNSRDQTPLAGKAIDIGAVFVGDHQAAVGQADDGLWIEADSSVDSLREFRKSGACWPYRYRIEPRHGLTLIVCQQSRAENFGFHLILEKA